MKIKSFGVRFANAFIASLRPVFGPPGTCIYQVTCTQYAKNTLEQKPFWLAAPLITLRVLSCNPLTALWIRVRNRN
ncbi:membrane protein insertion efficiency factor YidD [Candidatus Babeliales bacterium]|nr:membrane protein insertion efficiency factor YidD [Candidatus Babeliales bacterium]